MAVSGERVSGCWAWAACVSVWLGCAAEPAPQRPLQFPQFPSERQLDRLEYPDSVRWIPPWPGLHVPRWRLAGPLPEDRGSQRGSSPSLSDLALREFTRTNHNLEGDERLTCIAREVARFEAVHSELPAASLLDFIARRCGWTEPDFVVTSFGAISGAINADQLSKILIDNLNDAAFHGEIGVWLEQGESSSQLVAVLGVRGNPVNVRIHDRAERPSVDVFGSVNPSKRVWA